MIDAINNVLAHAGIKIISVEAGQAAVVPDGYKLADLEQFLAKPRRVREKVKLYNVADFVAYVMRFKTPQSTIFVTPNLDDVGAAKPLAIAVIDYHGDEPTWNDHTASLIPTKSPAYEALVALDKEGLMAQDQFALRLRDLARFCASHPAAEILEIVSTMTLTSTGAFASLSDDASGSIRLPADLLYRVPKQAGQPVQLGIRLPERRWLELELVRQVADDVRQQTSLMTIVGTR
jgi:uncharacterized protein YfdQ (DUF2303 family)